MLSACLLGGGGGVGAGVAALLNKMGKLPRAAPLTRPVLYHNTAPLLVSYLLASALFSKALKTWEEIHNSDCAAVQGTWARLLSTFSGVTMLETEALNEAI